MGEHAMDNAGLTGKVALVTGGAGAIGTATCKRLAGAGVRVAIADLRGDAAEQCALTIREDGGEAEAFAVDLASEAEINSLADAVIARFGQIDILHNNAAATSGVFERDGTLLEQTAERWDTTFAVNVRAPMLLCRQVVAHMIANGGGVIINTSSGASELPSADARTAYGPSKAALETLTRYIALQYGAQGIRCNAILPGVVMTPAMKDMFTAQQLDAMIGRTMLRRFNLPEDIAAMVAFLASDDARQVTGQLIRVDGGRP
jgi:NAD(P)-dependent dehydrogenase (short-subunit alcohol dehydrogenase family)